MPERNVLPTESSVLLGMALHSDFSCLNERRVCPINGLAIDTQPHQGESKQRIPRNQVGACAEYLTQDMENEFLWH